MKFDASMDEVDTAIAHFTQSWFLANDGPIMDTLMAHLDSAFDATVMKGDGTQTDSTSQPALESQPDPPHRSPARMKPVSPRQQLQSVLWEKHLGFCGKWQLNVVPGCAAGIPNQFNYHPFRFIDH